MKKLKHDATRAFRGHLVRDEERAERAKEPHGPSADAVARGFRGHVKAESNAAQEARLKGLATRASRVIEARD